MRRAGAGRRAGVRHRPAEAAAASTRFPAASSTSTSACRRTTAAPGTNFWPLVNGEPEYCGATIHFLDVGVDTGPIIAHVRPEIAAGDGPHDIGNKTIVAAAERAGRRGARAHARRRCAACRSRATAASTSAPTSRRPRCDRLYANFARGMIDDYLRDQAGARRARCRSSRWRRRDAMTPTLPGGDVPLRARQRGDAVSGDPRAAAGAVRAAARLAAGATTTSSAWPSSKRRSTAARRCRRTRRCSRSTTGSSITTTTVFPILRGARADRRVLPGAGRRAARRRGCSACTRRTSCWRTLGAEAFGRAVLDECDARRGRAARRPRARVRRRPLGGRRRARDQAPAELRAAVRRSPIACSTRCSRGTSATEHGVRARRSTSTSAMIARDGARRHGVRLSHALASDAVAAVASRSRTRAARRRRVDSRR